jgi:hypothetical protein
MIKRIEEERARIGRYQPTVGSAKFFNDRQYHGDFEWLILSYLTRALRNAGWSYPEYAENLQPPQPDFQTYLTPNMPYWLIETAEVLPPDYRRGDFHRTAARNGHKPSNGWEPQLQPWSSYRQIFRTKLAKPYASNASLLIYDDMTASDFSDYAPWHERLFAQLKTWTFDSATTCDLTRSEYENIFVVDASGFGAVRLYPHWDVIRPRRSYRDFGIEQNSTANLEPARNGVSSLATPLRG